MSVIESLKEKIYSGEYITKKEALTLLKEDTKALQKAANEIREHFCKDKFDMCTIINGKSGLCSENCKYCAQSAHYKTDVETYPLLDTEEILKQAKYNHEKGVLRYSVVTSGKALSNAEVDSLCDTFREIRKTCPISLCISGGLLTFEQFTKLKDAGVERVHNNLEAGENFFPNICTTHTFADKVEAIKNAKKAGLDVCSGGIMGLGETMEDRIDMAFSLRELEIDSIPVNLLNPIKGTPLENQTPLTKDEFEKIVAIYRFILTKAYIRLAGGRGLLTDKGEGCFTGGANATISGDMLTTAGYTIQSDMELIGKLGYRCTL